MRLRFTLAEADPRKRYMTKKMKLSYTFEDSMRDLGGTEPDAAELQRLVEYYPTYEWEHRMKLLHGVFENKSIEQLLADKLVAKGIGPRLSKQQKGAHIRWIVTKFRKTVVRLLYLRLRIDGSIPQRTANQQLLRQFHSEKTTGDGGQSHMRKMTHSPVLDG